MQLDDRSGVIARKSVGQSIHSFDVNSSERLQVVQVAEERDAAAPGETVHPDDELTVAVCPVAFVVFAQNSAGMDHLVKLFDNRFEKLKSCIPFDGRVTVYNVHQTGELVLILRNLVGQQFGLGHDLIRGLDVLLSQETGLPIHVDEDPLTCVVRGCGRILDDEAKYWSVLAT